MCLSMSVRNWPKAKFNPLDWYVLQNRSIYPRYSIGQAQISIIWIFNDTLVTMTGYMESMLKALEWL